VPGNRVALISEDLWRQQFGGADTAVGTVLRLHSTDRPGEQELVTVVGVLAAPPWRINGFQDLLRPLGGPRMFSLARLPADAPFDAAAAQLSATLRGQIATADSGWRMTLVSALDEHVYRVRPMLQALLGIALLLLLLSVSSAGAIIVTRADERRHEMAVRRALGASSIRLARQVGAEMTVTWVVATGLGLVSTAALGPAVGHRVEVLGGVSVPAGVSSVQLDPVIVACIVFASLLPFALFGLAPLLRGMLISSSGDLSKTRATTTRGTASARRALVVVQVALAVALPVNALLLVQSVRGMASVSLGFDGRNLLKSHLLLPRTGYPDGQARQRAMTGALDRVRAVPGVLSATVIHPHPFRGTVSAEFECEGCPPDGSSALRATPQTIAPNYFEVLGIPLAAGRVFREGDDAASAPVAMISRELARRFGGAQEALGRRVRPQSRTNDGTWHTIVGVVGDVRKTFGDTLYPDVYTAFAQNPRAYFALLVRTAGAPLQLGSEVRRAVAAEDAALALSDMETMDEVLQSRRGQQAILASFAGAAAALALILSAGALYAVVAYLASHRRREFALRLALGARSRSIAALVAREGVWLCAVGGTIGVGLAAAGATILRAQLFGIGTLDPRTYLAAMIVVMTVAAAALATPAARAARHSPANVLRDDS
jgi:predicted permease